MLTVSQRIRQFIDNVPPVVRLALLLLILLRVPWLFSLVERDEGVFGYVGFVLATGGAPYADVVDHHGLTLYVLYAISYHLFGPGVIPMRLLVLGLQMLQIGLLYDLAARWFKRTAAAWTVICFVLFTNIPVFEAHYGLTQPLAMPLGLLALWIYERRCAGASGKASGGYTRWYLLVWLLIALATSIRLTLVMAGVALALTVCVDTLRQAQTWQAGLLTLLRRGLLALAMLLLVWAVIALWLLHLGSLDEFIVILGETFVYGVQTAYTVPPMRRLTLLEGAPMFALAALGLLVILVQAGRLRRGHLLLLLWSLLFTFVVTRPPMWGHYFIQIIPFAALLAGVAFAYALQNRQKPENDPTLTRFKSRYFGGRAIARPYTTVANRRDTRWGIRRWLLVVIFISTWLISIPHIVGHYPNMHPPIPEGRQLFNLADQLSYSDQMATGALLNDLMRRLQAQDPAAKLYVYGNSPLIYWLSEQRAPVRDTYAINYFGWVVHEHGDPHPFVTVRRPTTQVVLLSRLYRRPALTDVEYYVTQFYEHVATIGAVDIYRRPA